ncbi:MAG: oligosaccharyl transferase, archaeosortase A system-associated [Methanoregulaceae archaeon]|nr:MAG: oligosaccharyl transferase, archaeosortase A system-associated [Methanoregulaceae archaeon]
MDISSFKHYQSHVIVLLLLFFMAIAFLLRILPAIVTRDLAFFPVYDTDTWYNLRQIEVMVHNFPQYNWFDPMTAYPAGKLIDWGPLYPFLAAVLCLITGAATRIGIISTSGFVSPILAVLMVPVMYGIGKKLGDYKTGLVAAGLISVTSLVYFTFSSYGMIDHHAAEVLFSTLFFFVYLYALIYARENPVDCKNRSTLPYFSLLSALAGFVYFLGLITSTTVILSLLVIAVYIFVQGLADFYSKKSSDYLCVLNIVLLGVASILFILFGFKREGISFSQYSVGILYIHLALMAEVVVIRILAEIFQKKRAWFFISTAGLCLAALVLSQIIPSLQSISEQALDLLFGFSVYTVGVQETLPLSWANAFETLNAGIFLAAGGFLALGYSLWKKQERELIFFAIWSVLMLLITIQHQRFLYYFTVNIVLLSAICITEPLRWENNPLCQDVSSFFSRNEESSPAIIPGKKPPAPSKQGRKKRVEPVPVKARPAGTYLAGICIIAVCLLAVIHLALSIQQDYQYGMSARERVIPGDWMESLTWLNRNTPDTGIDYFGQYDRKLYTPPKNSYGIMAVWDAGHWNTFFAHRVPITNPFQDNLGGGRGTAAFFLAENESKGISILNEFRGRYIITDSSMAVDRFTNLVPWVSGSVDISRYIKWFLVPDAKDPLQLTKVHKYDDGYFRTMVVRLHNLDGSMTEPTTAEYMRYVIRLPTARESAEATGYSRVITDKNTVTVSSLDNRSPIIPEGKELLPSTYAALYTGQPDRPLQKVPALRQFRLIHESEQNASVTPFPESDSFTLPGIKMVKIFEFVKGARITGTGVIELDVVTNTGRTFTYRQDSIDGEFIVPYSTTESAYEVRATGPYNIAGTTLYFTVTEDDVTSGKKVTGPS